MGLFDSRDGASDDGSTAQVQLYTPGLNTAGCANFGTVEVLHGQSVVVLQQQQQHASTPVTSTVPIVLQVPGPADQGMQQVLDVQSTMQPTQQQVYVLPSGEQVVCLDSHLGTMQPAQQFITCVDPQQGHVGYGDMQGQVQHMQLQESVQQFTNGNTVVQWVVSSTPDLQQQQDLQAGPGSALSQVGANAESKFPAHGLLACL